jgi:T5SS/PEP-CTERM-associated repeat protein
MGLALRTGNIRANSAIEADQGQFTLTLRRLCDHRNKGQPGMFLLDVFSLVRSCRGRTPARACASAAIVMICLLVIGASHARAQQCPNSGADCNVTSGTLVINTSPNTSLNTNISPGATLAIVSGGVLNDFFTLFNDGALNISANGVANFLFGGANIGTVAGSSSVTVSGAGAALNVSNVQTNFGTVAGAVSTMTISNGGSVATADDHIGFQPGSTASVTVTGAGSLWNENGTQIVGDHGDGSLTIATARR